MIKIIKPGIQTSVQDLGRTGFRHMGVCQSGALDSHALAIANILAGNPEHYAGLEIAAGPVEIACQDDTMIAVSGADFNARVYDGAGKQLAAVARGWRYRILRGQRLAFAGSPGGGRAYLALRGGINVPQLMGSRATDIGGGFGGLAGRCLAVGDCLSLGEAAAKLTGNATEKTAGYRSSTARTAIRALPGPEYQHFTQGQQQRFWHTDWQLSAAGNRMGYRLQTSDLQNATTTPSDTGSSDGGSGTLLSHGVVPGTIQVPANGEPIVLLADGQTTGGYPRIASVIQADLGQLVQMGHKTRFRFIPCTLAQALAALREQQTHRYRLQLAINAAREP